MPIWGPAFLVKAEDNVEKIVIADPVFHQNCDFSALEIQSTT